MRKMQKNLDDTKENLKIKERQLNMDKESASKHQNNYQTTCDEIKELKEKLKGNIYLI